MNCKEKLKYVYPDKLYTPEMIDYELDSLGEVPEYARLPLAKSLSLLPKEVIDFAIKNYVFISEEHSNSGTHYTFNTILFKNKLGFISLNSNLWDKKPINIAFTIAHEVAHAFKGHAIKTCDDTAWKNYVKREKETDKLAVKWLSKHYKKETLLKLCHSSKLYQ